MSNPEPDPPAHKRTRSRNKLIAGVAVYLGALGGIMVIGGGTSPTTQTADWIICQDYVEPPATAFVDGRNIDCWDVLTQGTTTTTVGPGTTTTTSAPTTTTTTIVNGNPYPAQTGDLVLADISDVPSDFDPYDFTAVCPGGWGCADPPGPEGGRPESDWFQGIFRVKCQYSHVGYYDPILAPGIGPNFMHLHMFFGNRDLDDNNNYALIRGENNGLNPEGSCSGGPINRTGYWSPVVFDSNDDIVVPLEFEIYYKCEAAGGLNTVADREHLCENQIEKYPAGFRYVTGVNPHGGYFAGDFSYHSWSCDGRSAKTLQQLGSCSGEIRAMIAFPHCWDGVHLWKEDNSHVGWGPSQNWGGPDQYVAAHGGDISQTWMHCDPNGPHPVPILRQSQFVTFPAAADTADWYLSSDRMDHGHGGAYNHEGGLTWHADWLEGWDPLIHEHWWQGCIKVRFNCSEVIGEWSTFGNLYLEPPIIPQHPQAGGRISGFTPSP